MGEEEGRPDKLAVVVDLEGAASMMVAYRVADAQGRVLSETLDRAVAAAPPARDRSA
jgi:hypothetical protein